MERKEAMCGGEENGMWNVLRQRERCVERKKATREGDGSVVWRERERCVEGKGATCGGGGSDVWRGREQGV